MGTFRCLLMAYLIPASVQLFVAVTASRDLYSEALLSFKSEFVDHFDSLTDWNVPSERNPDGKIHACSWSGVKCDQNSTSVIGLDLSSKKLGGVLSGKQFKFFNELVDLNLSYNAFSGEFPVGIINLTRLRSLDISRNNFSGKFPSGISGLMNLAVLDAFSNSFSGALPVEISKLENLKILNLAGSYFKGPIPSEYGHFKSLEFIHLAGNFLSGNLPPELGKLKTVTHMEIGYNTYQGSIPWQFGNMSKLHYLDISGANLSGSIPKELSNLTKLESLFLFRNRLTGLVPMDFSRIENLTNLDLSDNHISGPIPESFKELKNLKLLSLMYNKMSGSVPEGIADLPSLETLLIWNNLFSGLLPQNLGGNRRLRWVDVSTNNFSGGIPRDICSGRALFKLILFSNKFSGELSPSLDNCSLLVRLRIEDNSFSGDIPLKFSNLPDISYVDLSKNNFSGGIPREIGQASNLQYFNISNNPYLGGEVPSETWSLPLLQNFSASSCGISSNLPQFHSCKSISVIDLNTNNLSGTIPESISNCQSLFRIDLANNNLSGHIPEKLASLPVLNFLDLSHNNLNGSIPSKFSDSSSLLFLNVSFNDISGSIPSKEAFRSMGRSSFIGNPKLCGAPLRSCSGSISIHGSTGIGKLIVILVLCAGVVIFITILALCVFYFRKGSEGQWKMVSFAGLPQFTANDILRSFSSSESKEGLLSPSCKTVLPTGITVSVKKIEWETKRMRDISEVVTQLGNVRYKNINRLLGFCYNKQMGYLLYDYLPNGNLTEKITIKREWESKYKLIMGIARGLCFLHHNCYPAIAHGNLKSSNIVFDESMEPYLTELGFNYLLHLNGGSFRPTNSDRETGVISNVIKEELCKDVYSFGEIVLEILTNGSQPAGGTIFQTKPKDLLLKEIYNENEITNSSQDEIKVVLEVAFLCTKSRLSDRPSMEDALKKLLAAGMKPQKI